MKLLRELNQLSFTKEQITESVKTNNGILKLKGIIQRADAKNQNGRIYPRDILVKAIEPYMKLVKERRSHGELDHCYQGNSSILTISGWKQLKDISDNETILSLNTETSKIEAQEIRRKVVVEGYTGNLYRFSNGKNFSMTVSPNHKVLLWDRNGKPYKLKAFEVAEKLRNKDSKLAHSCVKHNFSYEPMNPKTHFTIPGTNTKIPMNLWAAFFGIWIAEGDVAGSRGGRVTNRVGLCQKKFEQTNMIQTEIMDLMIEHMHWNANVRKSDQTTYWNFRNDMLHSYMSQFGNSHTKFLPEEVFTEWSVEARETLLKWMLFGDGKNRTSNRTGRHVKEYATTSRRLAEDVHRLYVTLGYKPFIKVQEPKDVVIDGRDVFSENCSPVYVVAGNVSNTYVDYRFFSVEEIPVVDETLYCVTVENGTFMAMDADTKTTHWTGNCDEMVVNLKNASHIITDIQILENGDVMGEIEVLNTPMGNIVRALIEQQVTVGISSRAVGSISNNGFADVVGDDLHIVCWDMVSEPSTEMAFMFKEAKELSPTDMKKFLSKEQRLHNLCGELLSSSNNKLIS